MEVPPVFQAFVAALEAEFAFLVDKYGFEQLPGEQYGHEFVVIYRRYPIVGIGVNYEAFSTPHITVSVKEGALEEKLSSDALRLLARRRVPGWQEPHMRGGDLSEERFRDFFRQYRELLEEHFQELLTVGLSPTSPGAADDVDGIEPVPAEPPADTGRRARPWGAAIALIAFVMMVLEFRYFAVNDLPDPSGSVRIGWSTLFLLGLPWLALVAGTIQVFSGVDIRDYAPVFAAKSLPQRLGIALGVIAVSMIATGLAVALA